MESPSRDAMMKFLLEGVPSKDSHRRTAELRRLGDHEIKREYAKARKAAEETHAEEVRQTTQHIKNAGPDLDDWRARDPWTVHQATVLSLAKDPDVLTEERLSLLPSKDGFVLQYRKRRKQIEQGVAARYFTHQIRPVEFIDWAREKRIALNDALVSLLPEPETDLRAELGRAQSEIASLAVQIQTLTKQNDKLRSDGRASAATTEANTLRRILLGVATTKYRFDGGALKSPAAGRIASDVQSAGYSVSEDAVLSHLRAALGQFGKGDRVA